jgi:hypothetical protein
MKLEAVPHVRRILLAAALAVCAYIPALRMPFVEDDYVIIPMSNVYARADWTPLWHDVDYRTRPMQLFMNVALDRAFGYRPRPFYAANILLHVLCVLLIYAAGAWTALGFTAAFWAACFSAVYEGHAEAILWPSGSSELLVFLFGMAAWVCWIRWLEGGRAIWNVVAVAAFFLALFSKESACVFPALMLLPVLADPGKWRRALVGIAPFVALAILYVGWIWFTRVDKPGYDDIRFSLSSPWPLVIVKSFWRMVFPWGLAAAAILVWIDWPGVSHKTTGRKIGLASLWMIVGILPYSFLTYMTQLPSRAMYLGSAGLAMLVGAAAARLYQEKRRTLLVVFSAVVLIANTEILWVKKMSQMRERVEPSELLKQAAAQARGPVTIECTPLLPAIAEAVVEQSGGTMAAPEPRRETHCFDIQFQNRAGEMVRIDRPMAAAKHGAFY